MPVVGLIISNGREEVKIRFEDIPTERFDYPILKAVQDYIWDPHNPISASALSVCLYQRYLMNKLQIFVRSDAYMRMMFGTGMHTQLQCMEIPVSWTADGVVVSGSVDYVHDDTVVDFKTTVKIPQAPYDTHIHQVNIYAHLLAHNESGEPMQVSRGQVIYINHYGNYVAHDVAIFDVEDFIVTRARVLHRAIYEDVAPSPEPSFLCKYCFVNDICLPF